MNALLDREVLFFGGKGGVGKTTCASAMALAASRAGKRVLLVSTDPAHSTSDIFERPIGSEPTPIAPSLHAMEIDAASESQRYVAEVKAHIAELFGPAILKEASRQIDLAATMPGAEEVALFDRMGALIRGEDERFDLIIFDTAPTGHTLRLIRMPELMEAWIKALSRSRRAMLGIEQDDKQDPIMMTLNERLERLRLLRARLVSGRTTGFVLVLIA
jgi:arsenite-transporting ATPase